jgi:hypothetical protein
MVAGSIAYERLESIVKIGAYDFMSSITDVLKLDVRIIS